MAILDRYTLTEGGLAWQFLAYTPSLPDDRIRLKLFQQEAGKSWQRYDEGCLYLEDCRQSQELTGWLAVFPAGQQQDLLAWLGSLPDLALASSASQARH